MKNKLGRVLIVLVAFMMVLCGAGVPQFIRNNVYAAETTEYALLAPSFGNSIENLVGQGIDETEIDSFTPFNETSLMRMEGNSYKPAIEGEEGYKRINASINISNQVSSITLDSNNTINYVLNAWVFFDIGLYNITRGLTFVLSDEAGENFIKLELDAGSLKDLLKRDSLQNYDEKIFSSVTSATIGWCKISIPFASGIITGAIAKENKFQFNKLNIYQDDVNSGDMPLSFYNITLSERNDITTPTAYVQDYANVVLKNATIVDDNTKYYQGENFTDILTKNELFAACWIGRDNYLAAGNSSKLVVEADPGLGLSNIITMSYGSSGFKMSQPSYTIKYCIKYNGRNISVASDMLVVSSYGKGVWLEPITGDLVIGNEYKLYYDVHEAFTGDGVTFTSSDESILKILNVNKQDKYITVKAEKKGDVTIKIVLQDDRLVDTSYEEGIINEDFNISVVKATKNVNTTVVMLWIALGLLLLGLVYLAIRAIISARKVEVK